MLTGMIVVMGVIRIVKAWELSPAMWHMIYKVDSLYARRVHGI